MKNTMKNSMKKALSTTAIIIAISITSGCASTGGFTTNINGVNTDRGSWCSRNVLPCLAAIGAGGAVGYMVLKGGGDKAEPKKDKPKDSN